MRHDEGVDIHQAILVGSLAGPGASSRVAWVAMAAAPETVVTGDAVVLDVQIAQLPVRAVGALIDIVVVVLGYIVGVMLWAAAVTQFDDALSAATLIIFTVLTLVGYPIAIETATRGRFAGQDGDGPSGGVRRRRPGTFPPEPCFIALAGFVEDLDVLRRAGGHL